MISQGQLGKVSLWRRNFEFSTIIINLACLGHLYAKGTMIFHGYYYDLVKSNRKGCIYKPCRAYLDLEVVIRVG